ncbi:hypothetical protein CC78DRAFT_611032 [Lojkania enalia]|uniref:Uncharacterized protein n=1 Tax=Lojkania enalia TaxID=147567 RepID=A0A9P4NDE4_9PLEO|nr:hypothetical protein CC78DRAFT_611032 [Didymosphaeria enalia]
MRPCYYIVQLRPNSDGLKSISPTDPQANRDRILAGSRVEAPCQRKEPGNSGSPKPDLANDWGKWGTNKIRDPRLLRLGLSSETALLTSKTSVQHMYGRSHGPGLLARRWGSSSWGQDEAFQAPTARHHESSGRVEGPREERIAGAASDCRRGMATRSACGVELIGGERGEAQSARLCRRWLTSPALVSPCPMRGSVPKVPSASVSLHHTTTVGRLDVDSRHARQLPVQRRRVTRAPRAAPIALCHGTDCAIARFCHLRPRTAQQTRQLHGNKERVSGAIIPPLLAIAMQATVFGSRPALFGSSIRARYAFHTSICIVLDDGISSIAANAPFRWALDQYPGNWPATRPVQHVKAAGQAAGQAAVMATYRLPGSFVTKPARHEPRILR